MRLRDEIEPALDSFDTNFQAIKPSVHTGQTFFDRGQRNLDVEHLVNDAIKLVIEATKVLKYNVVRFVRHQPYSAATICAGSRTPTSSTSAFREYSSMRASIS
jgi:hypothetical protein